MTRSRLFKQSFMAPVGQTEKSAGAGGAIPHASAPGVQPAQDSPADLASLGGLLYFMGRKPEVDHMTWDYEDASPEEVTQQIAAMTPEERRSMEQAAANGLGVAWGEAKPRYWDAGGNEIFPDDNLFQRMSRAVGGWFR